MIKCPDCGANATLGFLPGSVYCHDECDRKTNETKDIKYFSYACWPTVLGNVAPTFVTEDPWLAYNEAIQTPLKTLLVVESEDGREPSKFEGESFDMVLYLARVLEVLTPEEFKEKYLKE